LVQHTFIALTRHVNQGRVKNHDNIKYSAEVAIFKLSLSMIFKL